MAILHGDEKNEGFPRRVSVKEFAVADFIKEHLLTNKPVIVCGSTQNWLAHKQWLNEDGTPNFSFLLQRFGNESVPVTCCSNRKVQAMQFSDFIHEHLNNTDCDLYMRDWHFMSDTKSQNEWYQVPSYFQSDWVNNDAISSPSIFNGDYRFCYMGGSNTFTGFHSDVFNSNSWSANICGKKRWYMLPEGCELNLSNDPDNVVDLRTDPLFYKAGGFVFEQMPGEIVFVPTGWFHQVHNEGFTISINHNWINSFNFYKVMGLMFERLECCMKEVRLMRNDLTEHVKYVEEFLRLDYGLNVKSAIELCELILKNRIYIGGFDQSELKEHCECLSINSLCDNCKHFISDNDYLTCKKYVEILKDKQKLLNQLKWLAMRE